MKRTKDRALDIVEQGAAEAAQDVRNHFEYAAEKCESPIERILVAEFVRPWTGQAFDTRCEVLTPPSGLIDHVEAPPIEGIYLWPQIKIGPYRVDFVVGAVRLDGERTYAIIECDGHDFHEKTKHQAQRDKARDCFLAGKGYRVLRYTGSEIYRNPTVVWDEIIKILLGIAD